MTRLSWVIDRGYTHGFDGHRKVVVIRPAGPVYVLSSGRFERVWMDRYWELKLWYEKRAIAELVYLHLKGEIDLEELQP